MVSMCKHHEEYATTCLEALQRWYNKDTGLWESTNWWNAGNCLEAIIDYSRLLNTDKYHYIIANTYEKQLQRTHKFLNDYHDDECWWALAWVKAYDLIGDRRYLEAADFIFQHMRDGHEERRSGGWDEDVCDGGLWWNVTEDRKEKNAITNELFLVLTSRLYLRTHNPLYLEWANKEWRWFEKTDLWDETRCLIFDKLDLETGNVRDTSTFTYNQGVILGGLIDWCQAVAGERWGGRKLWYLLLAEKIANAAIMHLVNKDGLLTEKVHVDRPEEEPDSDDLDGPQFKGIFVRYLGYLIQTLTETFDYPPLYTHYIDFILQNAGAVWQNSRTEDNTFGRLWGQAPGRTDAARQCIALDLFNAAIIASRLKEKLKREEEMKIYLHIEQVSDFFEDAGEHDGWLQWRCKQTGCIIRGAILRDFYRSFGNKHLCGLTYLGLPKTNEIDVEGAVIQQFERGFVACDPEHKLDEPPGSDAIYLMQTNASKLVELGLIPASEDEKKRSSGVASLCYECHAFYYSWYGTEVRDKAWHHWDGGSIGYIPPASICSDYYPLLNPYSSNDPDIVSQHMDYLRMAGIGTFIVCWWGRNDYTDNAVPLILEKAQEKGIKVGFLIDQYEHRSVFSVAGDIMYLYDRYGRHEAFYHDPRFGNKGVFYIYAPQERIDIRRGHEDWQGALDKLHDDVAYNGIFLAQSSDVNVVEQGHFDGLFTYDVATEGIEKTFFGIGSRLQEMGKRWSPSVGPGYMDIRNRGLIDKVKQRLAGETYDKMFDAALGSFPTYVSITSFNEWHEGTQIEPARVANLPDGRVYASYEENGLVGEEASKFYLKKTCDWIEQENW